MGKLLCLVFSDSAASFYYPAGSSPITYVGSARLLRDRVLETLIQLTWDSLFPFGVGADFGTMNDEIHIGLRSNYGGERPFGISNTDSWQHLYAVGKTGTGKSTLLHHIIVQRIAAGQGVTVIDPHGDLAVDLLNFIPPNRTDDLVYFNPADVEFPLGINLLANVLPDDRHLVASGIVNAFKSIWHQSWGPRMEYILHNGLTSLLDCQNVTLLGLNRMLTDPQYRRWVVGQVKDPVVRSFWVNEFELYDPRFRREAISPIQNKLGQFLMNPRIRNILGQVKSKVDLRFMMDTGRILIVNLSKGQLGDEAANLLGSLLTSQIQVSAMRRVNVPESERLEHFLLIDEFFNFTTESFAKILSEVRKYRLSLTLANQYIGQLSDTVREAIFGNVGTIVAFRVGQSDAETLSKEFGSAYPPSCFIELGRYEIVVKLMVDGMTIEPFLGRTIRTDHKRYGRKDALIQRSREKYATRRGIVEEKIARWMNSSGGCGNSGQREF